MYTWYICSYIGQLHIHVNKPKKCFTHERLNHLILDTELESKSLYGSIWRDKLAKFVSFHVTNYIFTKEDGEFMVKHKALPEEMLWFVTTYEVPYLLFWQTIWEQYILSGEFVSLFIWYEKDIVYFTSASGD